MEGRRTESKDAHSKLQNSELESRLRYWLDDKRLRRSLRRELKGLLRAEVSVERWSSIHADKADRIAATDAVFSISQSARDEFREFLRGKIGGTVAEWDPQEKMDNRAKAGLAHSVLADIMSDSGFEWLDGLRSPKVSADTKTDLKATAMGLLKEAAEEFEKSEPR